MDELPAHDNTTVQGDCLKYFFSGMNLQPMTIQPDQRLVSQIFFSRDESPAYDDTTGSKVGVSNIFFPGMNLQPMTIQQD